MKIKRVLCLILTLVMLLALSGTGYAEGSAGEKHLDLGISFCYSSIDAHKDYYGWMTSCYGVTEALFRIGDDLSLLPCVAESYASDGSVWTIKLRDNACFSNGEAVTPEMCIRNLQRVAEVNERFAYMAGYQYAVLDEHSFSIDTGELYPTLVNDLASPEFAILDLDNTTDFDNAIIATGPFVIDKFIPEGDVSVVRNENYYGGEVKLDSVKFFYMPEDEPKLFAMQNGEIQGYDSVTAGAYEVYKLNPELYQLTEAPGTRLQFYFLNKASLSDNLRAAINGIVDKENIAAYMKGTTTAAVGPFSANAAYGQVSVPKLTADEARALIEADGYTLGADGVYEKDGQRLVINICYYAGRSLDTIATILQAQLKEIGIDSKLTLEEDPDATYIATRDFDLALYCMIADKSGDPYYFIDSTLRQGAYYDITGFHSDECEELINELAKETEPARRAELANRIIQMSIDDNVMGYLGLFNKITVLQPGITGFADTNPFDFYIVFADTDID